jgi:hypothetical protein
MTKGRKTWIGVAIAAGIAAFVIWRLWPKRTQTEIRFDVPSSSTNQDFVITGSGAAGANDDDTSNLVDRAAG